jgi:hypothetical protein
MNNITTTNSSYTYTPTVYTSTLVPNGTWIIDPGHTHNNITWNGTGTYTSTTITPPVDLKLKTCRMCNHAHIEAQKGCIELVGYSVQFIICLCEEYVPKDNLEYLEWCYNKKQQQ